MNQKNLLLLSSSRVGDTAYLAHNREWIKRTIGDAPLLFIPYAGVGMTHAEYTSKVRDALASVSIEVKGIEEYDDAAAAVSDAKAIAVGGGNTFQLLKLIYENDLIAPLRAAVLNGTPYVGWSAGSNIAGKTIKTTNDMPIVEPPSFDALNLVNLQMNPHYTDYHPPGFNGETRDDRLNEFIALNPTETVLGLPEGTGLELRAGELLWHGSDRPVLIDNTGKHTQHDLQRLAALIG
tara:strand:+ start:540 stop:1247 length:708 start_codon:yes stop_codon:yes gene_type:complete